MALDTEAKRWSMMQLASGPSAYPVVINPSGSDFDSVVERCALLKIYGANVSADITPPVLSSPTGTASGATTATGTVDTTEGNGTLYFWATTNSSEAAASIKANGETQSVTASGTQNVVVTGLTASTTYYIHYVQDDAATNESNVVSSASFLTSSAVGPGGGGGGGGIAYTIGGRRRNRTKELFDEIEKSLREAISGEEVGLESVQTEEQIEKAVTRLNRISVDYKGFKRRLKKIEDDVADYQRKRRQMLEDDDEDFMMMVH